MRTDSATYVDNSLNTAAYLQTSSGMIHNVPDETTWSHVNVDDVQPPENRRKPDRPKVARRREK